jgi:lactoylglutathione lyase
MAKYLHTMIRVSSLEDTIAFFEVLGLREIRRRPDEKGRYTNVFLAAPGDEAAAVELTYNWDPEPYTGGRNFGHLAYAVDNIYDTCNAFIARGVTINRPLRDGRMAFVRTPDGISIELLQAGEALPPAEPWTSMANTGSWQSEMPLAWLPDHARESTRDDRRGQRGPVAPGLSRTASGGPRGARGCPGARVVPRHAPRRTLGRVGTSIR